MNKPQKLSAEQLAEYLGDIGRLSPFTCELLKAHIAYLENEIRRLNRIIIAHQRATGRMLKIASDRQHKAKKTS